MAESWYPGRYVTHRELREAFHHLNQRIQELQMTTQADVDTITAQVQQVQNDLNGARTQLQAEIDSLAQNNPQLDLTSLQQAVQPLDDAVKSLGALQPTSPNPPQPAPAPASVDVPSSENVSASGNTVDEPPPSNG